MEHNPISKEDAYRSLCEMAASCVDLMEPELSCLQQAAQRALALHDKAPTARKHSDLFQAASENAVRCIATYFGNWRRSPQSFGQAPLVSQRMSSTLRELWKYVEKYQPSASKPVLPSLKSSASEIKKLNETITQLHFEQPEGLRRPLEPADFSKDTDIVTGVEAMRIDDSEPTTLFPSDIDVDPQADILPLPDHESKWKRPRSTVQSASDEDEPADTAAARRSRSIREDSEDPLERQSSETRERKTPKRRSKDSNGEERASVDEGPSRKKRRPKKRVPRRDSSDSEDNSARRSTTSESARPAPQPQPTPASPQPEREPYFLRMLSTATQNVNGPVNINNMGNVYGGNYTYYTNTQPQSSFGR